MSLVDFVEGTSSLRMPDSLVACKQHWSINLARLAGTGPEGIQLLIMNCS
jgi:hypothetical protein